MTLVTVADFAKESGVLPITLYKMIESRGVDYIEKKQGVKKPFKLYDKSTLETLFNERAIKKEQSLARAELKKSRRKPKKTESSIKLNVSKLW